jgi:hypothetical protein
MSPIVETSSCSTMFQHPAQPPPGLQRKQVAAVLRAVADNRRWDEFDLHQGAPPVIRWARRADQPRLVLTTWTTQLPVTFWALSLNSMIP